MSKYIPFTTEQKERAASVDLEEFLRRRGEKLITSGRDKRLASDHSITIRGCEWFDHATEQGGRAISFVKQFYGLSYPDAMSLLLGDDLGGSYPAAREKEPEPAKPFTLPAQSESMRRVYAYLLQKRCIDREILNAFVRKKLIYESCEKSRDGTKEYHNAVFVGFDEHGVPRHGHKRGLYTMGQSYRGNIEGSDPKHSFHYLGGDDTLYVFEAPIDLLSYISLFPEGWQAHNYVACCGTSSIPVLEMLRQLSQLQQVYLCMDNDAAGHAASERMGKLLEERGISAERLPPPQQDREDEPVQNRSKRTGTTISRQNRKTKWKGASYAKPSADNVGHDQKLQHRDIGRGRAGDVRRHRWVLYVVLSLYTQRHQVPHRG